MKNEIIVWTVIMLIAIPIALFIGKTTLNFAPFYFNVERPLTAIAFLITIVLGILNK